MIINIVIGILKYTVAAVVITMWAVVILGVGMGVFRYLFGAAV